MSVAGGPKIAGMGRIGDSDIILCLDATGAYETGPELLTSGTCGQRAAPYGYQDTDDVFDQLTMRGFHAKHDASSGQANAGSPVTIPLELGKTYMVRFDCDLISGTGYGRPRLNIARDYNYGAMTDDGLPPVNMNYSSNNTYVNSCTDGKNEFIVEITTDPTWGNSTIGFVTFNAQEYTISNLSCKELFPFKDLTGTVTSTIRQNDVTPSFDGRSASATVLPSVYPLRYIWDFDGTDDYLDTDLYLSSTCSISCWYKRTETDITQGALGRIMNVNAWNNTGTNNFFYMMVTDPYYNPSPGGSVEVWAYGFTSGSRDDWYPSGQKYDSYLDVWRNVCLTFDGSSGYAYIDGVYLGSDTLPFTGWKSGDPGYSASGNGHSTLLFGGRRDYGSTASPTSFFNGEMANCMVFDVTLTSAQVKDNFNAQRSRFGV